MALRDGDAIVSRPSTPRQHSHRAVELRVGAGGVAAVERDGDRRLDADALEPPPVDENVLDGQQQQALVADQERRRREHRALGVGADQGPEPIFLEPVGEHFLAAPRAAVDQGGDGLAPLGADDFGLAVAVRHLHGRRAGVEEVEIPGLRPAPAVAQIPDQRVRVLERTLGNQLLERALIAAAGV